MTLSTNVGLIMALYVLSFIDGIVSVISTLIWIVSLFSREMSSMFWFWCILTTYLIGLVLLLAIVYLLGSSLTTVASSVGSNLQNVFGNKNQTK